MKKRALVVIWLGLVAMVSAGTPQETIDGWAAAFIANDTAKLAEHYSAANPVLVMHWDGKVDRGHEAVVATGKKVFGEVEFLAMKTENLVLNEGDGVATADFIFLALMSPKANEAKLRLTVRASMTLAKEGEDWKIVHEALSPINGVAPVQQAE